MNVSLLQSPPRVLLLIPFVIFGLSAQVSAQKSPYKNLATATNTAIADTIAGVNLMVYKVSPVPKHGDLTITLIQTGGAGLPHIYKINYQPDPGFTGVDTFVVQHTYLNNWPYLVYQAYRVSVYPTILNARPDLAVTTAGTPVSIDVLANDTGGNPPFTVSLAPLSNNGTATVNGSNQVVFTPVAGFTGVAHVNYTVCDALQHCKTSQIDVGVHDNTPPAADTLRLVTTKNQRLSIPLSHNGFTLFQAPPNGIATLENGQSFRYIPAGNFTGKDHFVLANDAFGTTVYKTVEVTVLNTPSQNNMAMDDYVYTPKGKAITFNVRANDVGNLLVKSWVTPNGLPGTISGTLGNGTVTFTPNPNFTGVATFYYRLGNSQVPNLEMATVNVIVGNLNPAYSTFDFTTPEATPFVINYQIPFTGFSFDVQDQPDHGTCAFYPGFTIQTVNGQSVSGHNLLIYTPVNGYTGTDEFEIRYCVTANGQCQNVKVSMNVVDVIATPPPYCVDNCVWTGDVNGDGLVNNKDLLPLGYLMGFEGESRAGASLEWYGQFSGDWNNPFTGSKTDVKHADTDGSGVVTHEDTLALSLFYGQQHNLIPSIPPTSKNFPFQLKLLTPNPQVGDLVRVEVSLGTTAVPALDVYGFTFDVSLSPGIVDSALRMTFYDNSWLNLNAPSLWMTKNPKPGRLESAFTRTGGTSANGNGVIGECDFIIIDIIDGAKPGKHTIDNNFLITVNAPTFMSGDGTMASSADHSIEIPIARERDQPAASAGQDFFVYPSPASERLNVHLNGSEVIESLTIFDAMGRAVYTSGDMAVEHTEINVADFAEGFYVVSARTGTGNVTKKFQILR